MEILSSSQFHCFYSPDQSLRDERFKNGRRGRTPAAVSLRTADIGTALKVFDEIPQWDTYAWNTRIQGYLRSGGISNAVSTYLQMLLRGVRIDKRTLPRVLTASRLFRNLALGKQVHGHTLKLGFDSDRYVVSSLIEMYGSLDSTDAAKAAFDKSPVKNSVSWTVLARLYLADNKPRLVIDSFNEMVESGSIVDSVALLTALIACGKLKSIRDGRIVHQIAKKFGLESDILVGNSLLQMFIDCSCIDEARAIFDQMPSRDFISWTTVIRGYVKIGGFNEGLKLFRQMMNADGVKLKPDPLTISTVLPACARTAAGNHGREIHGYSIRHEIEPNLQVQNALIDMYMKSGFITYGSNIFSRMKKKDTVSWTVMILGLTLFGEGKRGVDLVEQMEKDDTIVMDDLAYSAALQACLNAKMVEKGRSYFGRIKSPTTAHYALMATLLLEAGLYDEAAGLIKQQRLQRSPEALRGVLEGCRAKEVMKVGKRVIDQLCELDPFDPDNYVMLSNWYGSYEKFDMVDKYRALIRDMGLKPRKAYSWIEHRNKVHVFGTGDVSHPRSEKIYWELDRLLGEKVENNTDYRLHDVDEERECDPIRHSEMLAVGFGIISKAGGTAIRVAKNHRVCQGCHGALKEISRVQPGREIVVKDTRFIHRFKDGCCSCE